MNTPFIKSLWRPCPVCGHVNGEHLTCIEFTPTPSEPLPPMFDVVLCESCGFCFDDLPATQTDFDAYYAALTKYAQADTGGSGGLSDADRDRWNRVIDMLSPFLTSSMRIADIGCGKGGLLLTLRERGFSNLIGIEPSEGCRAGLAAQGIACYASIQECLASETPFDCVLCCQTLEHVFSLDGFLTALKQLTRPDGVIYVEVPDAAGYVRHFHAPFYFFDREHINHFTRVSMDNLFIKKCGITPVLSRSGSASSVTGFQNPILYAVYRNTPSPDANIQHLDEETRNIRQYVELSVQNDHYPQLDALQGLPHPIFLWGLGAHLRRLMAKGSFAAFPVQGIIDRDKGNKGETLANLPVVSPAVLDESQNAQSIIVLTTILYAHQIQASLCERGFKGRILRANN